MSIDLERKAKLAKALEGLDLSSADGRAGISAVLRDLADAVPAAVEQEAARLQLARLGVRLR